MKRKLLTAFTVLTLMAMILTGEAKAGAIAYADNNITNISLMPGIMGNFALVGAPATASLSFADLNSVPGNANSNQPLDAMLSCQGAGCAGLAQNDFALHPPHLAQGDAVIAANLRAARNDALVNLSTTDVGSAFGTNTLRTDFMLAQADMLTLSFMADPFMRVLLHPNVGANSLALARLTVDITIDEMFGNFNRVFSWRPDGAAGGIMGGNELADPSNLNRELTQNVAGMQTFDPAAGAFSARTNQLAAGNYRIDILISEDAFADVTKVPEPGTLLLLGSGIAGLLALRRRQRQA